MNVYEVESYKNVSIDQLLDGQLKSPTQNTWVFVLAKARTEQCTQESIKMTLMLLERDGEKWLQVLKRFSHLEFKLVFSFCIKRMKTYKALIESVYKLGESEHQRMLQENIQKTIDGQRSDSSINLNELWTLYLQYLSQWVRNLPHRTLYSLQRIQKRLGNIENIYESLVDRQKVPFVKTLCEIIKIHEEKYMRRLELRRFWQSIPNTIIFLEQTLYKNSMIYRVANSLDSYDNRPQGMVVSMRENSREEQEVERDKEMMVMMLMKSCEVTILQDVFIRSTRLATVLLKAQVIDQSKYNSVEQVQRLQSSLIYHIRSDDLPSLISQLLVTLSQNIPNFLTLFVSQSMFYLNKDNLDQLVTSDIILKLCILSKLIIQHTECNGWEFSIKDLIDRLVVLSDSRSEIVQIKTLLMMHYFKEILPESYFTQYHSIIFRMLKSIVKESIQTNKKEYQNQYLMNDQYNKNIFNSNTNNVFNTTNNINNIYNPNTNVYNNNNTNIKSQSQSQIQAFSVKPFKYTSISYSQCIKILEQQTQRKQQHQKIQMKIRKKKFNNNKYVNDLFRNHVLQISDKLIDLLSVEGYCEEQTKILQIFRNLLVKYPIVAERSTQYLIKVLSRQFMAEYYRLRQASKMRDKNFAKILLLLQCLQLVWQQVTEQTYFHCQQHMVPIMELLKQHYQIDFQQQIVKIVGTMIVKANMITAELNNFIIYSKAILRNSQGSLLPIESLIKEICRADVARSVREQWAGLVMYMSNLFNEYLTHTISNQTIEVYHKQWVQSTHLIQLFIQTYTEQYELNQQLAQTLYNMQSILQTYNSPNQQINQLLMTIYHATHTTKGKSALLRFDHNCSSIKGQQFFNDDYYQRLFNRITQLSLYQQKYSLHLVQLTILDTLNVNLRKRIFDFSSPHNVLYPFIQSYKSLIINIHDLIPSKSNTPNDILPFNKINLTQYTTVILDSLRKDKVIDIQQFTQLKSIFLPQNYLISFKLFQ